MLRREKQAAQTQSVATSLYQELLLALGAPQLARRTKQWRREVAVFDIADPVADSILLNRRRQEDCRSLTRAVECFFKLSPMLRAQRQMFHATYRERMHASAISNLVSEEKLEDILDSVEEHDGAVENGDGHKALLLPQVESQVDELRLLALPPSKGESVLKESDRERTVRETRLYASVLGKYLIPRHEYLADKISAEFNPKQLARGVASPTQTRDVKTALHGTVSTSSDQKGSALEDTANADKFRNLPRHDHYDVNL